MRKALLLFMVTTVVACTSPEERKYLVAQEKLKEHLKAPSTASFQPFSEIKMDTNGYGLPIFRFWCESQNAMGVPIRAKATAGFDTSNGELAFLYYDEKDVYESPKQAAFSKAQMDSTLKAVQAETKALMDSLESVYR